MTKEVFTPYICMVSSQCSQTKRGSGEQSLCHVKHSSVVMRWRYMEEHKDLSVGWPGWTSADSRRAEDVKSCLLISDNYTWNLSYQSNHWFQNSMLRQEVSGIFNAQAARSGSLLQSYSSTSWKLPTNLAWAWPPFARQGTLSPRGVSLSVSACSTLHIPARASFWRDTAWKRSRDREVIRLDQQCLKSCSYHHWKHSVKCK